MVSNDPSSTNPSVSVPAPPKLGRVWEGGNGGETDSILSMFAQKEQEAAATLISNTKPTPTNENAAAFPAPKNIKPLCDNPASTCLPSSPTSSTFDESNNVETTMMARATKVIPSKPTSTPAPIPPIQSSQPQSSFSIPPRDPINDGLVSALTTKPALRRSRHSRVRSELPTMTGSLFPHPAPIVGVGAAAAAAVVVPKASGKNYFDLAASFDPVSSSFSAKSHDDQDEDIVTSMLNESVFSSKLKTQHKKKSHSRGRSLDFASMNLGIHHRTAQLQPSLSNDECPLQLAVPVASDDSSIVAVCEGKVSNATSPPRPNKAIPGAGNLSLSTVAGRPRVSHLPQTAEEVKSVAQQLRIGSPLRASSPLLTSLFDLPNRTGPTNTATITSPNRQHISVAAFAASQRNAVNAFPDALGLNSRPSHRHGQHASRHSRSKSAMPSSSAIVFGEVTSHIHANINSSVGQQQQPAHPLLSTSMANNINQKLDHPFNPKCLNTKSLRPPSPPKPNKKILKENIQNAAAKEKQHAIHKPKFKGPHRRHMTMDSARLYLSLSNSPATSLDEEEVQIAPSMSKDSTATVESTQGGKTKDKKKKKELEMKENQAKEKQPKEKKASEEVTMSTPPKPSQKKALQSCLKTPTSNDFASPKPAVSSAAIGKKTPCKKTSFVIGKSPGRTIKPKPSLKGSFGKHQFKEMFPSLMKKKSGEDSPDRRDEQEGVIDDFDLIQLSSSESSPGRLPSQDASEAAPPIPQTTIGGNIILRSSEVDPSAHQVEIPSKENVHSYAKLCELFEHYREVDQNFDFASLKGVTKDELDGMCMKTSIRHTHRVSNGPLMETIIFTEDHRSILETYSSAGRDFVLEDYIVLGNSEAPACNAAIFCSQYLRQFVVVLRGSAELQSKPFKNAHSGFAQESFSDYPEKVEIGCGYSSAYHEKENALETKIFETLDRLKDANPFFDVITTGHSFGGALATLAGTKYAAAHSEIRVSAIPFGCPKVGSTQFRSLVHSLPNLNVFRLELPTDSYITMPIESHHLYGGQSKWSHVGHSITLLSSGQTVEARTIRFDGATAASAANCGASSGMGGSKLFSTKKISLKTASSTTKKRMSDYLLSMDICCQWPTTFYTKIQGITRGIDQEERYVV